MFDNCSTIYLNLPYKIKGFAVYNTCEDFYTIVLNSRLSYTQNLSTYMHELKHIENNDFYNTLDVNTLETLAH